jgi:MFS family permease
LLSSSSANNRAIQAGHRLGPFANANFSLFFAGYTISLLGHSMVTVALSFAVFGMGGGAGQVSAVLAAETAPMVVLLLVGGVIADRFPRRLVMVGADIVRCVSEAVLAALLLTHHASLVAIMVLAAVIGAGDAFFAPGRNGLIPQLVAASELQSANAILSMAGALAAVIGPALGGILVAGAGPGWAIGIDAVGYAVSTVCLLRLRVAAEIVEAGQSFIRQLVTGWREFWARKWLWLVVLQFALLHLVVIGPIFVLGPLGFRHGAHGASLWGSLLGALGAGAMVGGALAMRVRSRRPLRVSVLMLLFFAVVPAALACQAPFAISLVAFFIGGVSLTGFGVLWSTTLQRQIPTEILSRVSAYDTFGSVCLLPAGYVLAAPMASVLGNSGALWIAAGFSLLATLVLLASRSVRGLVSG